jgi:hypothetical protein
LVLLMEVICITVVHIGWYHRSCFELSFARETKLLLTAAARFKRSDLINGELFTRRL